MPDHYADRIGFRALCLRGFAYMLLVAALMQAALLEAAHMPNVRFSETGLTEPLQSLLLLGGTILAIAARRLDDRLPHLTLLIIGLLGASLIREQDAWLDEFVFDGAWQVLAREPMLRSRIYRRVVCTPLSGTQVCALLPRYHRIYDGVEAELLLFVDDHFAHGNLRDWAAFTATAVELCQDTGVEQLDEQIARNAFALHGGVRSRPAATSAS